MNEKHCQRSAFILQFCNSYLFYKMHAIDLEEVWNREVTLQHIDNMFLSSHTTPVFFQIDQSFVRIQPLN